MDFMDILLKTYELYDEIKKSDQYNLIDDSLNRLLNDKEAKILIENFNNMKNKYEEASKYGDYFPGKKEIVNQFIESKGRLYTNVLYINYRDNLKKLNENLKEISVKINNAIFGKDSL